MTDASQATGSIHICSTMFITQLPPRREGNLSGSRQCHLLSFPVELESGYDASASQAINPVA
jgi:hypothetical protein